MIVAGAGGVVNRFTISIDRITTRNEEACQYFSHKPYLRAIIIRLYLHCSLNFATLATCAARPCLSRAGSSHATVATPQQLVCAVRASNMEANMHQFDDDTPVQDAPAQQTDPLTVIFEWIEESGDDDAHANAPQELTTLYPALPDSA